MINIPWYYTHKQCVYQYLWTRVGEDGHKKQLYLDDTNVCEHASPSVYVVVCMWVYMLEITSYLNWYPHTTGRDTWLFPYMLMSVNWGRSYSLTCLLHLIKSSYLTCLRKQDPGYLIISFLKLVFWIISM